MILFQFFHIYGLILGSAALVLLMVSQRQAKFFKFDPALLDEVLLPMIIGTIIGARLYHLLTDWRLYTHASFLDLIAIWNGGVGFLGAIVGGLIGLIVGISLLQRYQGKKYANFRALDMLTQFFTYLDLFSFGIPVAQSIGRFGNYFNHELYGLPTNLPWGILIDGKKYHPLFLYESICTFALFLFLLYCSRRKLFVIGKGQYASVYIFFYALIRFWLEFLRIQTDRWSGIAGVLSIAQWVCLLMMAMGVIVFWVRRHAPKKNWDFSLD